MHQKCPQQAAIAHGTVLQPSRPSGTHAALVLSLSLVICNADCDNIWEAAKTVVSRRRPHRCQAHIDAKWDLERRHEV